MSNPPPHVPPGAPALQQLFDVELPNGGKLYLQSAEEVDLWNTSRDKYIEDYHLTNVNDLNLLGIILQQQVTVFRAQRAINGMQPELDANKVPTGRYTQQPLDADEMQGWLKMLRDATDQIGKLEKQLGIDKVTREAGGTVSVSSYLRNLKKAAHERGIHISKRVVAFETFNMELRTKLRMLRNLDAEDRAYHNITPEAILEWAWDELSALDEVDKKFAREKGKLYVGKL